MKIFVRYMIMAVMLVGITMAGQAAETADGMLKKAAVAVNGSGGLTASFTIDYGQQKLTGTLKSSGKKFSLQTSSTSTWYDGKSMWIYNPKNNETTLINPTPQEVAEANPLSLVNSYSSSFTAAFAKSQISGSKTIVLTPKSKNNGYKSVHVTIPNGSSFPTKLVVIPSSGQKVTVSVSQVKSGLKLPESTFVYPKTKFPKAEIVDLR
ncbi:MAG: outer membrane lipoprotein carrier protein LolA [Muribaculaceae bacterium]|nr:outer membrane lipoprotein carrier protein LolA [Muribaculaceae bacterium]